VLLALNPTAVIRHTDGPCWRLWDVFANFVVLQLLQLHPASKNQGIAGKGYAVSIMVGDAGYDDVLTHRGNRLVLRYEASDFGGTLLEASLQGGLRLRVFLAERALGRELFAGFPKAGYLFLPFMRIKKKLPPNKERPAVFMLTATMANNECHAAFETEV